MSNRLTFEECEFLLQILREDRDNARQLKNMKPVDIETAAAFIGLPTNFDASEVSLSAWKEEMSSRVEKFDVIIEKIEGLYGL